MKKQPKKRIVKPHGGQVRFSKDYQPSGEAKSNGWKLRQAREAIADAFTRFSMMTLEDISAIREKFEKEDYTDLEGKKLTVAEAKAISYLSNKQFDVDFMNRGVEYVKERIDVTSGENPINFGLSELIKEARNAKKQPEPEAEPA